MVIGYCIVAMLWRPRYGSSWRVVGAHCLPSQEGRQTVGCHLPLFPHYTLLAHTQLLVCVFMVPRIGPIQTTCAHAVVLQQLNVGLARFVWPAHHSVRQPIISVRIASSRKRFIPGENGALNNVSWFFNCGSMFNYCILSWGAEDFSCKQSKVIAEYRYI